MNYTSLIAARLVGAEIMENSVVQNVVQNEKLSCHHFSGLAKPARKRR